MRQGWLPMGARSRAFTPGVTRGVCPPSIADWRFRIAGFANGDCRLRLTVADGNCRLPIGPPIADLRAASRFGFRHRHWQSTIDNLNTHSAVSIVNRQSNNRHSATGNRQSISRAPLAALLLTVVVSGCAAHAPPLVPD